MLYRPLGSNFHKFRKLIPIKLFISGQLSSNSTCTDSQMTIEEVPNSGNDSFVSLNQIHKCLKDNERQFQDGFCCITTYCTNCYEKREGLMYINKTTGFFICVDCQDSGDWRNVEPRIRKAAKNVMDVIESEAKIVARSKIHKHHLIPNFHLKWNELSESCKHVAELSPGEIREIISSFKLQINSHLKVFKDVSALYDDDQKCLFLPLSNGKKRIVGIKQLFLDGTEVSEPFKQCYGILRFVPANVTQKWNDAIIVGNVKDFFALSSRKHSYHVICIPYGINSFPQEILPLFEQYSKLILWFGNNNPGLMATRIFSKKLKEERCYMMKITDKRPSDFIEENSDVNISSVLKSAEPILHECITTFSKLRQEVWAEITNTDSAQGIKWRRFPTLNSLLRGHRRGELTVLTGPTGSGKTTFLSEYSLDLAMQGVRLKFKNFRVAFCISKEKSISNTIFDGRVVWTRHLLSSSNDRFVKVSTLWGSFEIRNQRLALTMLQQYCQQPLDSTEKFDYFAHQFEKLPIYFLKFHGQQSIEVVMNVVNHALYVYDLQHLIIDNLQFMLGLSQHEERFMDRFYKQDKVIAAFRTFASLSNCHVTLIIHPRKERDADELTVSSIFGSAKASQEADNIMIIQKQKMESLRVKKYLQILKNRYSGDLGIMPLNFNKSTLTFGGKSSRELEKQIMTIYEEDIQRMPVVV